jgi:peptidoglycan/xylan/chitin deacetylase (PgdA/CDA1 family)
MTLESGKSAELRRSTRFPKEKRAALTFISGAAAALLIMAVTIVGALSNGGRAKAAGAATVVSQGPTNVPQVAITFDDGPSTYTPQVLSILQQYGAHSTFFLWGQHVQQYPQYAKQEVSAGMEVGNHTWDHTDLTTLSSSAISSELSQTQTAIQQAAGVTPTLMRPPNGNYNSTVLSVAGSLGLSKVVIWSYVAGDYTNPQPSASDISSRVLSNTSNGSIILLHDGGGDRSNTVAALPSIIQGLQSRGLKLVTVSQLLSGTPPPATNTPSASSTPSPGSNLLTNGNAESGTSGWSATGGTLAAETSVVHSGTTALQLTSRSQAWNGPSQTVTSKLTNGKSYSTSVWVRTQSGTPSAKVSLALTVNGSTSYVTLAQGATVNSSGWTQVSGTATVSWSGTLSSAVWYVETASGTDNLYIDDASLQ